MCGSDQLCHALGALVDIVHRHQEFLNQADCLDTKKPKKVVGLTADTNLPNMEALAHAHAYATALQSTTAYP